DLGGVVGLHLEVLRGPGVGDPDGGGEVVDQDVAGLPGQGGEDPLLVLGERHLAGQLRADPGRGGRVGGDQQAGGELVVLGLADQVGGEVRRVGGVVGDDADLGGAVLAVGADGALQDPLGRGDVDVAGAGDHVDRRALVGSVGEHRQR